MTYTTPDGDTTKASPPPEEVGTQISFMGWAGGSVGLHPGSELRPPGWGLCREPLLVLTL